MSLVPPAAMTWIGPKTRRAGCRFRPPLRRTFGFRLESTGEASTYSRPVLGAVGTLKATPPPVQGPVETLSRKERGFLTGARSGRWARSSRAPTGQLPGELETHFSARFFDLLDPDPNLVTEP